MADVITRAKAHDPQAKLYYSVDAASWLRTGDTLASCAVSVVSGTALIDTTPAGSGSTSAAATISGTIATIAVISATAPEVQLQWRMVSADGEQDDRTTTLSVGAR